MATAIRTYSITCTCGEKMAVEAKSRDDALFKIRESLDELTMANHAAEKHPAGDAPTMEEMEEIIAVTLVED